MKMEITPGGITSSQLRQFYTQGARIELAESCWPAVEASRRAVDEVIQRDETVYGVNTGFGLLASERISVSDLAQLQVNLVRSHSAGTGDPLPPIVVRLILLLKLASLARGYSGVRREVIEILLRCINLNLLPYIPGQGSVGASGDLAPLAHLSLALIGEGEFLKLEEVHRDNLASECNFPVRADRSTSLASLESHGIEPLKLEAKEGLALLNGTQVSTALALVGWFKAQTAFRAAIVSGALSVDAARGSDTPFDARIHEVRNHSGQIRCAELYRDLLSGSQIRDSHRNCSRVQDPYSLRCQPQVMGACLESLLHVGRILLNEANAVSDNPLVFAADQQILSGGNFHAEPVALAADLTAIAIAEVGSLSERRIALMIDKHLSELPPFLVKSGGLNSGFMIPQVTAAALVAENKHLANPCSTDSLPTSANQEDHVSMACHAARRLIPMVKNLESILAIELLAASQGIDFLRPLRSSPKLEAAYAMVREAGAFYENDRTFHQEIERVRESIVGSPKRLEQVVSLEEIFEG